MDLTIGIEEIENKIVLRLEGRLDTTTSPILDKKVQKLIAEKKHFILLDFEHVEYMSSAGLRFLLSTTKKLHSLKGFLVLFSLTYDVEEIVKMAGFDRILILFANEKEALQYKPS